MPNKIKKRRIVKRNRCAPKEPIINKFECPICLDDIQKENIAKISCSHKFCFPCIQQWSRKEETCPVCRKLFEYIVKCETNETVFLEDVDDEYEVERMYNFLFDLMEIPLHPSELPLFISPPVHSLEAI